MKHARANDSQNGNALWFVLVAVALLAALTMAMTRSSDTVEQTGDVERARILASDLMRYTGGIKAAVDKMLMSGISESDLCFHSSEWGHNDYNGASCTETANQLFNVEGAGLGFQTFDFVTGWDIFGSHRVNNLETAEPDLIIQAQVSGTVCREINNLLNIPNPSGSAPADTIQNIVRFTGTYTLAAPDNTIGDNAAIFSGKESGCRREGSNHFFYQVLVKR